MGTTTTVRDSGVRATEVLIVAVEGAAEEAGEERVVGAAMHVVQAEGDLDSARRRPPWGRHMRGWGRRGQVEGGRRGGGGGSASSSSNGRRRRSGRAAVGMGMVMGTNTNVLFTAH